MNFIHHKHKNNLLKVSILIFIVFVVNFLFLYYFFQRDIVYSIDFSENEKSSKIDVQGLVEKYSLKEYREHSGVLVEVNEYEIKNNDVNIQIEVPPNYDQYKTLLIETNFENENHPSLEVGVRLQKDYKMGEKVYDWEYKYLDYKHLNNYKKYLGEEWNVVSDKNEGLTLFQKNSDFENIDAFLSNFPLPKKVEQTIIVDDVENKVFSYIPQVSVVNYTPSPIYEYDYVFPEGDTIDNTHTYIPHTFRSNLDFAIIFDSRIDSEVVFEFLKQDMNIRDGEDTYEFKVLDADGDIVFYNIMEDDGYVDSSKSLNIQKYSLRFQPDEDGIYFVHFISSLYDDSLLRNFDINMPKVMMNNFTVVDIDDFFGDNIIFKPMKFYASEGKLSLVGQHDFSLNQIVYVNGEMRQIPESNTLYLSQDYTEIETTINDLRISSDRYISPTIESYFLLESNVTSDFQLHTFQQNTPYVLADYIIPEKNEDMGHSSSQRFPMDKMYVSYDEDEQKRYINLKIRAKGLKDSGNSIIFNSLSISLK